MLVLTKSPRFFCGFVRAVKYLQNKKKSNFPSSPQPHLHMHRNSCDPWSVSWTLYFSFFNSLFKHIDYISFVEWNPKNLCHCIYICNTYTTTPEQQRTHKLYSTTPWSIFFIESPLFDLYETHLFLINLHTLFDHMWKKPWLHSS